MEEQVKDLVNMTWNRMFTEEYVEAEVQDMVSAVRKVMEDTGKSSEEILTHAMAYMLLRPNAHLFHALVDVHPAIAQMGAYVRAVPQNVEKKECPQETTTQPTPAVPRMRRLLD